VPHLQFDYGGPEPDPETLRAFTGAVTDLYAEEMRTTTGHVAVTVRTHPRAAVTIGRAEPGPTLVCDADVRRGRSFELKRAFALGVVDLAGEHLDVPRPNVKVVFTEHDGPDMMGADRVGGEWAGPEE
jgi:phenylpyruvate tautomerase PptA (4-oxalocrotonate tautomerase family)